LLTAVDAGVSEEEDEPNVSNETAILPGLYCKFMIRLGTMFIAVAIEFLNVIVKAALFVIWLMSPFMVNETVMGHGMLGGT
jgi:hypothetical protein